MRHPDIAISAFLGMLLLFCGPAAPAEKNARLTTYYYHRPPYYVHSDHGPPRGFLMDIADTALRMAGIAPNYMELPPKRILKHLREPEPACSVGWFKTPGRADFLRFSRPIYQNQPLAILTRQSEMDHLPPRLDIRAIFTRPLTMGRIDGFSYGAWTDEKIALYQPDRYQFAGTQENLVAMLLAGRIDYMLIAPEEAAYVFSESSRVRNRLTLVPIADAPAGNERFLVFSAAVAQETVDRIDAAIRKLVGSETYRRITSMNRIAPKTAGQ